MTWWTNNWTAQLLRTFQEMDREIESSKIGLAYIWRVKEVQQLREYEKVYKTHSGPVFNIHQSACSNAQDFLVKSLESVTSLFNFSRVFLQFLFLTSIFRGCIMRPYIFVYHGTSKIEHHFGRQLCIDSQNIWFYYVVHNNLIPFPGLKNGSRTHHWSIKDYH